MSASDAARASGAKPARAWLVKSEPSVYAFDQLVADGRTVWDGVRSHEAKNNLCAMKSGDIALFYHSNEGKSVVGIARVAREAYPDPADDAWSAVDLVPLEKLPREVSLAAIKADKRFAAMALVKKSRLSVGPVTPEELAAIVELGGSKTLGGGKTGAAKRAPPPASARKATKAAKPGKR